MLCKLNLFFSVFLYFHQQAIYFCCLMLFLFLLLCLCYFTFESQKYMNKVLSSKVATVLVGWFFALMFLSPKHWEKNIVFHNCNVCFFVMQSLLRLLG